MKVIIIDDEALAIDGLVSMIKYNFKDIQIVATANHVIDAVKLINLHQPDLLLLDINMPEYTGFDLLDMFPNSNFKIIFTTAYDKYAIRAFKYATVDYLLKPIESTELISAIDKVRNHIKQDANQIALFKASLKGDFNKITIATIEGYEFIELNNLIRIEADGNYSTLFLTNKKIITSKVLKYYDELLMEDSNFIRVHASHIINKRHILKFIKADGGSLVMSDNENISISSRKKQEVLDFLNLK